MPLCTDCRNEAFIVGGADDVYSAELARPCSRCGWEPDTYWIWSVDADVEWSDEEIQEFIDRLDKNSLSHSQKKYPCPIDGCEFRHWSVDRLDRHIKQEHGRMRLAMHRLFMELGDGR